MADTPRFVRREIVIDAPPERVLDAWADPREIPRWYVDDAMGDARTGQSVAWVLNGESYPFEVTTFKAGRRLELTNVGDEPWKGTVLGVDVQGEPAGTRVTVTQTGISDALRDWVPNLESGWACVLTLLKEYVERHWGEQRSGVQARRDVPVDPGVVAEALQSAESVAQWAGERPVALLASTPCGAVSTFSGFPGVFTIMGTTRMVEGAEQIAPLVVSYVGWGEAKTDAAAKKVEALADGLLTWAGSESMERGFGARRRQ